MNDSITVTFYSSGDIDEIKKTVDSVGKNLCYSGKIKYIIHDDFVGHPQQEDTRKWISECNLFSNIMFSETNLGIAGSRNVVYEFVKNEDIIFSLDHDIDLLFKINVDLIVKLMRNNSNINQMKFSRRALTGQNMRANSARSGTKWVKMFSEPLSKLSTKQMNIDGVNLIPVAGFSSGGPAFSKVSFVHEYMPWGGELSEITFNKKVYRGCATFEEVVSKGIFAFGKIGDPPYAGHRRAKHIGLWRR